LFPQVTALSKAPAFFILAGGSSALFFYDKGISPLLSPLIAMIITAGIIFLSTRMTVPRFWGFTVAIVLLSFLFSSLWLYRIEKPQVCEKNVFSSATVLYERSWGSKRAVLLEAQGRKYISKISPVYALKEGSRLRIRGYVLPLSDKRKENGFREDLFWKAKGVEGELILQKISAIPSSSINIHSWRTWLRQKILTSIPQNTRGYILASWLGIKDPDLVDSHSDSGTVHLLAVSGFHVAILASGLFLLFRSFMFRDLLISLCLWLYVALTGFSPSASRAALMLQLVLLSRLLGRPVTPVNSVSVAGIILLLINPYLFWSLGWRLSMAASLTISALVEMDISQWIRCLVLSPAVWMSTAGLTASSFGEVPLAGLVTNLVAIPVFGFLFPVASVLSFIRLTGVPFSDKLMFLSEVPFDLWKWVSRWFCDFFPFSLSSSVALSIASSLAFFAVLFKGMGYTFSRAMVSSLLVTFFLSFFSCYIVV
jgi:competence protein ComEC